MRSGLARMAHGWTVAGAADGSAALVRGFIRPAVRAVPGVMAQRLGCCRILLAAEVADGVASRWAVVEGGLEVAVSTAGIEDHDIAMELLECLGQALWERLSDAELRGYWMLLWGEISMGVEGEIDEPALEEKRQLLASRSQARSLERLARYGRASFAGTAAEYVHSLWHEVTTRTGPEYLSALSLRRRLELLLQWFPPNRGYRLFPAPGRAEAPRSGD